MTESTTTEDISSNEEAKNSLFDQPDHNDWGLIWLVWLAVPMAKSPSATLNHDLPENGIP